MQQSARGGVMAAPAKRSFFCKGLGLCSTQMWSWLSTAIPPIAPIAHFSGSGCGNVGSYRSFGTWTLGSSCPKTTSLLLIIHTAQSARPAAAAAITCFRFMIHPPCRLVWVGSSGPTRISLHSPSNSPVNYRATISIEKALKAQRVNGMSTFTGLYRGPLVPMIALFGVLSVTGCGETSDPSVATQKANPQGFAEREGLSLPQLSPDEPPPASNTLVLPLYHHYTDDLDAMVKRHAIRAIVTINPIGFFYDN